VEVRFTLGITNGWHRNAALLRIAVGEGVMFELPWESKSLGLRERAMGMTNNTLRTLE